MDITNKFQVKKNQSSILFFIHQFASNDQDNVGDDDFEYMMMMKGKKNMKKKQKTQNK